MVLNGQCLEKLQVNALRRPILLRPYFGKFGKVFDSQPRFKTFDSHYEVCSDVDNCFQSDN